MVTSDHALGGGAAAVAPNLKHGAGAGAEPGSLGLQATRLAAARVSRPGRVGQRDGAPKLGRHESPGAGSAATLHEGWTLSAGLSGEAYLPPREFLAAG